MFLSAFYVYSLIAGVFLFNSFWISSLIFIGVIVNLIFFDFFIRNYFGGKSKGRAVVLETITGLFVLYFLVFQSVDPGNHITHLAKMIFR